MHDSASNISSNNFMDNLVYTVKINAKVISYNQIMFREVLSLCGIEEQELIRSLHPTMNREQIFKTNKKRNTSTNDGGRSGSFFFFT